MSALREVLAKFGFDVDSKNLIAANTLVDASIANIGKLDGAITAGAAALGLGAFKSAADELSAQSAELYKDAIKSGLGFQEFQRLSYTTGIGAEKLTGIFRKLQQTTAAAGDKATDAAGGFDDLEQGIGRALTKKDAGKLFDSLGIKASEDVGENFDNIIHKLAEIKNPSERAALAMKFFGRAGTDLLPFLEKSPAELDKLSAQFETFGGITEDQRVELKRYASETKSFDLALKSLKNAAVVTLLPAFTAVIGAAVGLATRFAKGTDTTQLLKSAAIALGVAFVLVKGQALAAAASTALAWARVALPFIALASIIDDVIHFVKGDATTATGALLDMWFGEGSGDSVAAQMRKDLDKFSAAVGKAQGPTDTLIEIFKGLGAAIGSVFADTIPDAWNEFWRISNEEIGNGSGGFGDFVSETFRKIGIMASVSMLRAFDSIIGPRLSDLLGIRKGLQEGETYIASEGERIMKAQQERAENLAVPTNLDTAGQRAARGVDYGPINPYVAAANVAGPPEIKASATVTQSNQYTINVRSDADAGEIGQAAAEASRLDLAHATDAVTFRVIPH